MYFDLVFDICCVRMIVALTNEYRQVKVHRKRKINQDNVGKIIKKVRLINHFFACY